MSIAQTWFGPCDFDASLLQRGLESNVDQPPKTNTWLTLTKLPSGRQAIGAAADGSAAFVPGGTLRCGGLSLTDQMLVFRLN
jgi:hypothetical protein